jgi:hypothetical protein
MWFSTFDHFLVLASLVSVATAREGDPCIAFNQHGICQDLFLHQCLGYFSSQACPGREVSTFDASTDLQICCIEELCSPPGDLGHCLFNTDTRCRGTGFVGRQDCNGPSGTFIEELR